MPVIGTPVTSPEDSGASCATLATSPVAITRLYDIAIPTKRRAIYVAQGAKATSLITILDNLGNPVNLEPCDTGEVRVKIREVLSTRTADIVTVSGSFYSPGEGVISVEIPSSVRNNPAVYLLEVGLYDDDDELTYTNQLFLWVNKGLFGSPTHKAGGPPSLDEVRLFIRDNGPEENRLLDDFEFDLAEICHGATNAVRLWNESQPPIDMCFNTKTYCVPFRWLQAIAGHMMMVAAHRFRRNHLPYQAGGIAIDDQNKFQQYDRTGMILMQEYKEWVKQKKTEINCMAAITSTGSPYGSVAYKILNTGV